MATEDTPSQEEAVHVELTIARDADADADEDAHVAHDSPDVDIETEPARSKPEGKQDSAALRDREPGKSILPFARVQKIMKADKDLPMVARDATLLISLATEAFIKRLSQACQRLAEREKRTTVQQKDVAHIVRRVDEFLFLEEIIGSQEPTGKRRPQKSKADPGEPGDRDESQPTIQNFMQKANESEEPEGAR